MSDTEILKPSQKTVELDTDGYEDKEIVVQETKEDNKIKIVNEEVIPDGTVVNQHRDDKVDIQVQEETEKSKEENKPQTKTDDLASYSKDVRSRINELTGKMREAQRREKAALQYAKGLQKQVEEVKVRFPKIEESYLKEFEARVDSDQVQATRELQAAIESQDAVAISKANQRLVQVSIEKERLSNTKYMRQQEAEKVKAAPKQEFNEDQIYANMPKTSEKAKKWAEKNDWFLNDDIMTEAALKLDAKIKGEGIEVDSDEYYNELDKRLKDYFPQKFTNSQPQVDEVKQEQRRHVQNVATANRNQTGRRTVKLTKSQLAISKKLGVPPEEYAKYVKN
jgi:hypothetical protein